MCLVYFTPITCFFQRPDLCMFWTNLSFLSYFRWLVWPAIVNHIQSRYCILNHQKIFSMISQSNYTYSLNFYLDRQFTAFTIVHALSESMRVTSKLFQLNPEYPGPVKAMGMCLFRSLFLLQYLLLNISLLLLQLTKLLYHFLSAIWKNFPL